MSHDYCHIDEAVQDLKDKGELERTLKPLQEKLKVFKKLQKSVLPQCITFRDNSKTQTWRSSMNSRSFSSFLEKARIDILREEEFEKTSAMVNRIDQLRQDVITCKHN
ncbi:hypothetical protein J4Q44_G00239160 [Coregonus suidteri]|uniref:Uncharacterized protein n=1 Tax=Coregonus suidteri TaxID=861788 RepID=A0AAN8QMU6_9TELE